MVFCLVYGLAPLTTLHGVIGYGQSCFETLTVFLFTIFILSIVTIFGQKSLYLYNLGLVYNGIGVYQEVWL